MRIHVAAVTVKFEEGNYTGLAGHTYRLSPDREHDIMTIDDSKIESLEVREDSSLGFYLAYEPEDEFPKYIGLTRI